MNVNGRPKIKRIGRKCKNCQSEFLVKDNTPSTKLIFCSRKCRNTDIGEREKNRIAVEKYFIETYGVKSPQQIPEFRKRQHDAMFEKYGVTHALKSKVFRDKCKATWIENFGTTPLSLPEVRYKTKSKLEQQKILEETKLQRYGNSTFNNSLAIQNTKCKKKGYIDYADWISQLPERDRYYKEVWKITNKNINCVPGYNKEIRGLAGIDGAYQIDHIISIHYGYLNNIPPETMGGLKNLQFIPWKENVIKSDKN